MQLLNRLLVTVAAAAVAVALLVLIIVVWADPEGGVERLADLTSYLDERTGDTTPRVVLTLGAGGIAALALVVLLLEVVPGGGDRIRLSGAQEGETELSASSVNRRIEAELRSLPEVDDAKARVRPHGRGVAVGLELWLQPSASLAQKSDEASRVVRDTLEQRIGVPLERKPTVHLRYADAAQFAPATRPAPLPAPTERFAEAEPVGEAPPPSADAPEAEDTASAEGDDLGQR